MPAQRAEQLLTEWVNLGDGAGLDKDTERTKAATRLMLSFPETFQLSRERRTELLQLDGVEEPTEDQLNQLTRLDDRLIFVEQVRELLRCVWRSTDQRHRDWLIFLVRAAHHHLLSHSANTHTEYMAGYTIRLEKDESTGEMKAYPHSGPSDSLTALREGRRQRMWNYLRRQHRSDLPEVELTFDLSADVWAPEMNTFERVMYYFQRNEDRARRCAYPECGTPYFFAKKKGQRYCSPDCSDDAKREQNRLWWRENRGKQRD